MQILHQTIKNIVDKVTQEIDSQRLANNISAEERSC